MQPAAQTLDPARFAIVAAGDHVWCLARDLKDQNFFAPFQLICRRADNGEIVWKSTDLPDYAPFDLVGQPLLADGKLFIAAKTQANPQQRQGQPQQFVLAIQPHDGKVALEDRDRHVPPGRPDVLLPVQPRHGRPSLDWSTAPARSTSTRTSACSPGSTPIPECSTGDTATRPTPYQSRLTSSTTTSPRSPRSSAVRRSRPVRRSWSRECSPERLYAIDPNRMKVLWERPITKASRLLARRRRRRVFRRCGARAPSTSRRGSSCGRRVCPAAATEAKCWCGRTASGN